MPVPLLPYIGLQGPTHVFFVWSQLAQNVVVVVIVVDVDVNAEIDWCIY